MHACVRACVMCVQGSLSVRLFSLSCLPCWLFVSLFSLSSPSVRSPLSACPNDPRLPASYHRCAGPDKPPPPPAQGDLALLSLEQAPRSCPQDTQFCQKMGRLPSLWPSPSKELQFCRPEHRMQTIPPEQTPALVSGCRPRTWPKSKPGFLSKSLGAPPPPLPHGRFLTNVRRPKQGQ